MVKVPLAADRKPRVPFAGISPVVFPHFFEMRKRAVQQFGKQI
jgi:hypothetical protein